MGLILLLGVILVGIAAALMTRALALPRPRAALTVDQIGSYGFESPVGRPVADTADQSASRRPLSFGLGSLAGVIGSRVLSRLPTPNREELRRYLLAAGMYTTSPAKLLGYQAVAAVALPLFWLWLSVSGGKSPIFIVIGTIVSLLGGWRLPLFVVQRRARARLANIDYEMPDLVDTLVATVEAGVAFAAAMQIAARRFRGPLAQELQLLLQEQNMGLDLKTALTHLLERADTPAMRSFVRSIVQGELLGVSISQSLRSLATEMRQRRRAAAEERAQKAPVKMLFPLMFLIVPSIFIILLGPAAFKIHALFGGGG